MALKVKLKRFFSEKTDLDKSGQTTTAAATAATAAKGTTSSVAEMKKQGRFVEEVDSDIESSGNESENEIDEKVGAAAAAGGVVGGAGSGTGGKCEFEDFPKDYKLLSKLGEGAFSAVYRAEHVPSKLMVAIKIINKELLSNKQLANINNEINVMKRLRHCNVLKLLDLYNKSKYCYIVLEYCDGGEVFNKIIEYTYFSEDLSRHIFMQLVSAVGYLHSVDVAHRDIKPENLLFNTIPMARRSREEFEKTKRNSDDNSKVDEGTFLPGKGGGSIGVVKLADFGLAKRLKSDNSSVSNLKTPCGTAGYTAPEVITCSNGTKVRMFADRVSQKNYYTKAVDIWSLGCFLYTILCGFPPFYDDDPAQLTNKIINGDYVFLKPWWDEISNDAKDLVSRMLAINPDERISISEIWNHPWIKGHYTESMEASSYFVEQEAQHIEYTEECCTSEHIEHASNLVNLSSPRAGAIKKVFNNPAMSSSAYGKLGMGASVKFIDDFQGLSMNERKKLPKSPLPPKEGLPIMNFKDVFNVNSSTLTEEHEDSNDADDDDYEDESAEDEEEEGDEEEGEEEEEEEANDSNEVDDDDYEDDSLEEEQHDELTSLDKFNIKTLESQRSSPNSDSSEDLNSLHEDTNDGYQTRSSSIISGINGDYKFTLSLNDSSLLRRRSSTNKSAKSLT